MNYLRTAGVVLLTAALTYVVLEISIWQAGGIPCEGRMQVHAAGPVEVQAAREAYLAKISDGPKRDRLLVTIEKLQQELDRQNEMIRQYREESGK